MAQGEEIPFLMAFPTAFETKLVSQKRRIKVDSATCHNGTTVLEASQTGK